MVTKCFSVLDSKASVFGTPFFSATAGSALRMFTDLVNDKNSIVSRHPEDFSLYVIGEFDDSTGVFRPEVPLNLATAVSVVKAILPVPTPSNDPKVS